jgi:DNA repair exonuclease SbcCD ATPase subunit
MSNPVIETDIADILNEIKSDQKKILEEVNTLKLGQARIEGKIEAVDEKLSGQIKALDTKVDQLDKRIGNQEFTNRGVFIGLVVVILGGAAKLFGFMGNP